MQAPRRVLLLYIAAVLDINECSLDFLFCSEAQKQIYMKILYTEVVREVIELNNAEGLKVVFGLLYKEILAALYSSGRKYLSAALEYWRDSNESRVSIIPLPFNTVARAAFVLDINRLRQQKRCFVILAKEREIKASL